MSVGVKTLKFLVGQDDTALVGACIPFLDVFAFDDGDEERYEDDLAGSDCAASLLQLASGMKRHLPPAPKFDASSTLLPFSGSSSAASDAIWGRKSSVPFSMDSSSVTSVHPMIVVASDLSLSVASSDKSPGSKVCRVRKAAKPFHSSPLKCTRLDGFLFVSEAWVKDLINGMPRFTYEYLRNFREFLELEYKEMFAMFANVGAAGMTGSVVRKLACIDWLLRILAKTRCQDSRLGKDAGFVLTLSPVNGESEPGRSTRALLCGRSIDFKDTLTSNFAFRELQRAGKSWPAGGANAKGTKGITEPFELLGLGPHSDAVSWKVRSGQFRGPEDSDPDNPFDVMEGEIVKVRETDGMYYKEFCFSLDRLKKCVLDVRQRVYKAGYPVDELPVGKKPRFSKKNPVP